MHTYVIWISIWTKQVESGNSKYFTKFCRRSNLHNAFDFTAVIRTWFPTRGHTFKQWRLPAGSWDIATYRSCFTATIRRLWWYRLIERYVRGYRFALSIVYRDKLAIYVRIAVVFFPVCCHYLPLAGDRCLFWLNALCWDIARRRNKDRRRRWVNRA